MEISGIQMNVEKQAGFIAAPVSICMLRPCQGHTLGLQNLLLLPPDFQPPASSDNRARKCALRSAFKSGWEKSPSVLVYVLRNSPMGTTEARADNNGAFLLASMGMGLCPSTLLKKLLLYKRLSLQSVFILSFIIHEPHGEH
ncbi:hypothetical protein ATANTOWER_011437 [Ataeniobius toweri]|uniref:Uncharacterized protein n=1 Tax=Ataeniobius toweri TaxID=208326 RepID=A0ABU7B8Z1_9TELE|nr:hypothetical protein [Ataeniobius toweri]